MPLSERAAAPSAAMQWRSAGAEAGAEVAELASGRPHALGDTPIVVATLATCESSSAPRFPALAKILPRGVIDVVFTDCCAVSIFE